MNTSLEEIQKAIQTVIPKGSVVILQTPESNLDALARSIECINSSLLELYNVTLIACPDDIKITVVYPGADVKLEKL